MRAVFLVALKQTATALSFHKHAFVSSVWKIETSTETTRKHFSLGRKRLKCKRKLAAAEMSSEYEHNVGQLLAEKRAKLQELEKNQEKNAGRIASLKLEIETLESMYENYNLGMNVFRRAQGGRTGLRE